MAKPITLYKLIILYMQEEIDLPLSGSQISEFILDREYTTYFHLQQAISELVEAKLLEASVSRNMTYYKLTEEGKTTLGFFRKEIPPAIREEVRHYFAENGYEIRRRLLTTADYYQTADSEYMVRCQVRQKDSQVIEISVLVPSQEAAETICNNWESKCQDIYSHLMETLL